MSARSEGNICEISMSSKRKKLIRKTRPIIIRLRMYTEIRLKILRPKTVMKTPIRKAKIKEMDMQAANTVTMWASTKRRLKIRVGDCHWGRCIQKTNVDNDVIPRAKRQIKRKKLANFEKNKILNLNGKGTRLEKSRESGKMRSHSRMEIKLMTSIAKSRK